MPRTKKAIPMETTEPRKKPGRRPMSPEEKAEAAKVRAAQKAKANNMKPEIFVQFQESETTVDALVEAAKADFRTVKKRALITEMKLYVKPEERMAYYVINGEHEGKISF